MKKFNAFTLAEVLITLGIIGVVAAITMPTVIANINERVNSERQANIAQKVTQAMEQMRAHGLLNTQYASTDAFVDELQKYLKIAKRCDSEHIADCWPTATVTTGDGEEYEVSKAKTGKNLNHKENKTNNVGLILADGASLIMTYNENGGTLDVGDPVSAMKKELPIGGGKMKEFPYSTSVAGSIDFVMDVNGGKGPNSEKIGDKWNDIRSFNGAQFAKGMVCDFEVGALCVKKFDSNTYSAVDCRSSNSSSPDYEYCNPTPSGERFDTWAGAKKTCSALDGMHLASRSELVTIFVAQKTDPKISAGGCYWTPEEEKYDAAKAYCSMSGDSLNGKKGSLGAMCVGSN